MLLAITLILISAFTNALIGAMMKREGDRLHFRGMMGGISALLVIPALFILPFPPAPVWVWLALGSALHLTYQISQIAAYNRGDMSVVYPLMRGSAPALAAIFAYFILDETVVAREILGLSIAVMALIGFGWAAKPSSQDLKRQTFEGQKLGMTNLRAAIGFALFCGGLTALYTVIDAKGIRLSGMKLSYIACFFLLDGIGIWVIIRVMRGKGFLDGIRAKLPLGVGAAIMNLVCYSTALLAFSVAPIAGMAALRETSIVFGAILAAVWLKEGFGLRRIGLACLLVFGLILMQVS